MVSQILYHGAVVLLSFICVDLGPFPTDHDFITFTRARTNILCEKEAEKKNYPVRESMSFAIRSTPHVCLCPWAGCLDSLSLNLPSFKKRALVAHDYETWIGHRHLAHGVCFIIFKVLITEERALLTL